MVIFFLLLNSLSTVKLTGFLSFPSLCCLIMSTKTLSIYIMLSSVQSFTCIIHCIITPMLWGEAPNELMADTRFII